MSATLREVHCKDLLKARIHASDGELGSLKDVYFDDETWNIRYFVVDTGSWLPGRKVLVSPHSLASTDAEHNALSMNISKEQIRNSPEISSDQPVSRQEEAKLGQYYGWPSVYPATFMAGGMLGAGVTYTGADYARTGMPRADEASDAAQHDDHLRSVNEITGYKIEATDGEIGVVDDFLVDLRQGRLTSVLADTSHLTESRVILVPVDLVRAIYWDKRVVHLLGSRFEIESASGET